MILLCESCSSLPEKQRGLCCGPVLEETDRQLFCYSLSVVQKGLCCGPVSLEETGRHFLFLLVITERMHLKVREIYGKQLIFWKMETGHVLDCCCSSSCCSASSCSSTCALNYV